MSRLALTDGVSVLLLVNGTDHLTLANAYGLAGQSTTSEQAGTDTPTNVRGEVAG